MEQMETAAINANLSNLPEPAHILYCIGQTGIRVKFSDIIIHLVLLISPSFPVHIVGRRISCERNVYKILGNLGTMLMIGLSCP